MRQPKRKLPLCATTYWVLLNKYVSWRLESCSSGTTVCSVPSWISPNELASAQKGSRPDRARDVNV